MTEPVQTVSGARRALRIIIVLLLSSWALFENAPTLYRLWHPVGTFGVSSDFAGRIVEVVPNSAGADAGIRVGDVVDLQRANPTARRWITSRPGVAPNSVIRVPLIRPHEKIVTVNLHARPQDFSFSEKLILVLRMLAAIIFVIVGSALVLMRPSPMTWGYYLFCIYLNPGTNVATFALLSDSAFRVDSAFDGVVAAAADVGLLLFALEFPHPVAGRWRRALVRLLPLLFVANASLRVYLDVAFYGRGVSTETMTRILYAAEGALYIAAIIIFADTYAKSAADERQRIRWAIVGFLVGLPAYSFSLLSYLTSLLPYSAPYWLFGVLQLVNGFGPLMVAYAVIRHHVIDVNFVIRRSLVYAVLTSFLISIFTFIDWFFIKTLEASSLGLAVEMLVAIALGFWFYGLHNYVDRFVDGVFFRHRHFAAQRLARAAVALPQASALETVSDLLAREPFDALQLSSAALFSRNSEGDFVRQSAQGWPPEASTVLPQDDRLLLDLRAQQQTIRVQDVGWRPPARFSGKAEPVLAVPVVVRRSLQAVALYGAHANGADFDSDEVRSIEALATAAAAAYDHLEAAAMTKLVAELRTEVERLRSTPATS